VASRDTAAKTGRHGSNDSHGIHTRCDWKTAMGEITERENDWGDRATAAAIATARRIVLGKDALINKNIPVGRLNDLMWGWIISAAIFAWIATRAEQATMEGLDVETVIRTTMLDPNPWDAGAVAAILPKLVDVPGIDWQKSLTDFSREQMVAFLVAALGLMRTAIRARDFGGGSITRKSVADELNNPVPSFQ
jgi:hypothetical protein